MKIRSIPTAAAVLLALQFSPLATWAQSTQSEPVFRLSGFSIQGPELVPRAKVMAVLDSFVGRDLTFEELRRATVLVEGLHAEQGYEVVRVLVPEQEIKPGEPLTLQIVDSRLANIEVSGNSHFSEAHIRQGLPVLAEGGLVNTIEMDKNLRLHNDNPSKLVRVRLEPAAEPGLVDAKVQVVDQDPLVRFVTLDNTGTDATGDYRLGLALQHNNVFGKAHTASFQFVTSPGRFSDVQVFALNYKVPLPRFNSVIEVGASDSSVDAGNLAVGASSVSVQGAGQTFALRGYYLLDRLGVFDQRIGLTLEQKKFESDVRLGGTGPSLIPSVGSRPLGLVYRLTDTQDTRQRSLELVYQKNLSAGGIYSDAQYRLINPDASADFDLLKLQGSWSDQLTPTWRLTARLQAQHTSYSLISGEQFGAGGVYSVRGFEEREASADTGFSQSLELMGPNLAKDGLWGLQRLNVLGFLEAAQLRNNRELIGVPRSQTIASTGLGLRFAFRPQQQFSLDLAHVLDGLPTQERGSWMLHFAFAMAF